MWGRKRKTGTPNDTGAAKAGQEHAEAVIRLVESQQPEVNQTVHRLERRSRRNHFAESMEKSMRGDAWKPSTS
jgi:hypothetical protein